MTRKYTIKNGGNILKKIEDASINFQCSRFDKTLKHYSIKKKCSNILTDFIQEYHQKNPDFIREYYGNNPDLLINLIVTATANNWIQIAKLNKRLQTHANGANYYQYSIKMHNVQK